MAAVATNLERPIFKKPNRPTVRLSSSDYDEKMLAYCEEEIEWDESACEWKATSVGIHTLLLEHTHPDVRAYLQKADDKGGFSLDEKDIVRLLIMIRPTMNYMKQEDKKEISTLKSNSDDVDLPGLKNYNLNVSDVRTRQKK